MKVEVTVLDSPFLIVGTVSVDVKRHCTKLRNEQYVNRLWPSGRALGR